jgi:hypothetical protein
MALRRYPDREPAEPIPPAASAAPIETPPKPQPEPADNLLQQQLAALHAAEQAAREQIARRHEVRPEALATVSIEQHIERMPISDHKKRLLRAHPELLEPEKAKTAAVHYRRALSSGVADDTPEMDEHILRGMRSEREWEQVGAGLAAVTQPPAAPAAPAKRSTIPVSAPVSRDIPSLGTGRGGPTSVTLSPAEREIARLSGISERQYGLNKLRLLQAKAEGRYLEPS